MVYIVSSMAGAIRAATSLLQLASCNMGVFGLLNKNLSYALDLCGKQHKPWLALPFPHILDRGFKRHASRSLARRIPSDTGQALHKGAGRASKPL